MEFGDMETVEYFRKFNYRDLAIFLIPVIVFSIYLFIFNPGIATTDTFNQFHQIASGAFTNWHPFFHTFIEMMCLSVYPSTISICVFQILVFSVMWTVICRYFRDDDGNVFKWQVIFSLIVCVIPINGLYSITMWKDILFSYCMMFLCFLIMVMIDRKGNVDLKFIVLLSLIMAFVSQLRGNGFYVVLVCIVVYMAYLFFKRNVKMGVALAILTVTFILLISSLNVAYEVSDNEKDAFATKLAHMLADYDLNLDIEDGDRQKIHTLINPDKINESYRKTNTDPIFAITDYKEFEANRSTYVDLAVKYSLRDPLHCIQYLFESSPMVWNIFKDGWNGRPYYMSADHDRLQSDFNYYYGAHKYNVTQPYENLSYANWGTPAFGALNNLALNIETSVFDTFLNSPALYMYISIILLIVMHALTRSKEVYLMYVPNLLNIVIVFFSTPIQDYRYLYANLLVCYLLVIIWMGLKRTSDESVLSRGFLKRIFK